MSGEILFSLFVSVMAIIFAGFLLLYQSSKSCRFKVYAPSLTCWRWYFSKERPYTQKIIKIALQLDITNVSNTRCLIRELELFVIVKGEKHALPLLQNGQFLQNFELTSSSVFQKNLLVCNESIDRLPPFFANESFQFYLSYRENRGKIQTIKVQKIDYIVSTPEKA